MLCDAYENNALIFCQTNGRPLHAHNISQRDFKRVIRQARVPMLRFHDLRHVCATLMLRQGIHPKGRGGTARPCICERDARRVLARTPWNARRSCSKPRRAAHRGHSLADVSAAAVYAKSDSEGSLEKPGGPVRKEFEPRPNSPSRPFWQMPLPPQSISASLLRRFSSSNSASGLPPSHESSGRTAKW